MITLIKFAVNYGKLSYSSLEFLFHIYSRTFNLLWQYFPFVSITVHTLACPASLFHHAGNANQMASQLCETKLSYHTCVNHLPIDCQQLNDSVIAGATLHRNNSKTHTHTTTVAVPVAEASREREGGGLQQFVGSLFMVLGVLVHIEAFAKRSQMTSKSGKSLFTPQKEWEGGLQAGLD